ncbi:MAG: radical SAM protein [Chloroflexi bacterium RBG_16_54_11]|nr:MAG: radical SAM protein [Chloroflexi bacterium RBG_16_54_11]
MIIREVNSKTILSPSKIYPYVINPYTGCQHGCSYCYAHLMKRFSGHREPWGQFVDAKVNAPDLLRREITRKKPDRVWMSGVCDPYQPLERKYRLTRQCLEILVEHNWPVTIQTRSALVLRDIDIFKLGINFEVGLSITTADERMRVIFESQAPPIRERLRALDELHRAGMRTYAMIAPILPGAENLPEILAGKVDYVRFDRMNYHYGDWVYRKYGLKEKITDEYFSQVEHLLTSKLARLGIPYD